MSAFLDGAADNLDHIPTSWLADIEPLRSKMGGSDSLRTKLAVQWNLHSMRLRRVFWARNYEDLSVNRIAEATYAPPPRTHLSRVMRVPAHQLSELQVYYPNPCRLMYLSLNRSS